MSEVISPNYYPEREEYQTPKNADEQFLEVLRLYPNRAECVWFLTGLNRVYKDQPFMKGFKIAAEIAADIRSQRSDLPMTDINYEFYYGVLLGTYVHIQPAVNIVPVRHIMQTPPVDEQATEAALRRFLPDWICEEPDVYEDTLEDSSPVFIASAYEFAERMYSDDINGRADFLAGFCYTDDLMKQSLFIDAQVAT